MFTTDDIRAIAIQIERNGEKTYRTAGSRAKDSNVAKVLLWMADEEQRHAKWFEALETDRKISPEHLELEAMGRSLLQDMVKDQPFSLSVEQLDRAENMERVLAQSLRFEQDTIDFYNMLRMFLENDKTTKELDQIIEEERRHAYILEKLKEKCVQGTAIDKSLFNEIKELGGAPGGTAH